MDGAVAVAKDNFIYSFWNILCGMGDFNFTLYKNDCIKIKFVSLASAINSFYNQ
jgi:hypothetical protein